jgi:hypothetical protein
MMAKTSETAKKRTSPRSTRAAKTADAADASASTPQDASPAAKSGKRATPGGAAAKRSGRKAATLGDPASVDPGAVAHRAYLRFVERGYAHGHDLEDWIVAERELADGAGRRGVRAAG